jgi:lysophospholipase L1-like esterase
MLLLAASGLLACGSSVESPKRVDLPVVSAAPPPVVAPEPAPTPSASASSSVESAAPTAPAEIPKGLVVLVVGDSFAQAMGVGLKARENDLGLRVVLRGKQATYIPEWAGPNFGLDRMVAQANPDLVIVALGGNELAMATPELRRPKVANLIKLLGDKPCVWASPPLWGIKDNGLLEVIRTESRPCRYFDSSKLAPDVPRGSDKIHPSAEGQKVWANALIDWLRSEQLPRSEPSPGFALRPRPDDE